MSEVVQMKGVESTLLVIEIPRLATVEQGTLHASSILRHLGDGTVSKRFPLTLVATRTMASAALPKCLSNSVCRDMEDTR